MKVSAAGGTPTAVTTFGSGETGHIRPSFLPDGRHFIYRAITNAFKGLPIYVGLLDSSERALVIRADASNVLFSRGRLLFLRESTLMAQPFDLERLTTTGDAIPIAEVIQTRGVGAAPVGVFTASADAVLAYERGSGGLDTRLLWFDRSGNEAGRLGDPGPYSDIEISPEGQQIAVSMPNPSALGRDLWIFDVVRNLRTRLTFDAADERSLIWSRDGTRVVFNSDRAGHLDLYTKAANGTGSEELLFADQSEKYPLAWSLDEQRLLYITAGGSTGNDLFLLSVSGNRKPTAFLNTPFSETPGRISPDGRWVAYTSNESGRAEVYVAPLEGRAGKWQVSTAGGSAPAWTRNGAEIIYLAPDNSFMAADVNGTAAAFRVGAVKALFRPRIAPVRYEYAVTPDGQRFLVNTLPEQTAASTVTVVVNWDAGLQH
jgi:eukaryotic-like serine/threonine-protein kinase